MNKVDGLAIIGPIVESMHDGWSTDCYDKFSEHFCDSMKEAINNENYEEQRKVMFTELGRHKKLEIATYHRNPHDLIVIYRVYFELRESPALAIYFFGEEKERVVINSATLHY